MKKQEYMDLLKGAKNLKKIYKKMDREHALLFRKTIYLTSNIRLSAKDRLWSYLNGDIKYHDLTKDL